MARTHVRAAAQSRFGSCAWAQVPPARGRGLRAVGSHGSRMEPAGVIGRHLRRRFGRTPPPRDLRRSNPTPARLSHPAAKFGHGENNKCGNEGAWPGLPTSSNRLSAHSSFLMAEWPLGGSAEWPCDRSGGHLLLALGDHRRGRRRPTQGGTSLRAVGYARHRIAEVALLLAAE